MFNKSERGQSWTGVAIGIAVIAIVAFIFWNIATLHRVNPGYVGVIVHYNEPGATAGRPIIEEVPTGKWVRISWLYDKIAQYPIAQQTLTMVQVLGEGQQQLRDDSVKCQDANGVPLFVDSSTLWRVDPEQAGELYVLRPGVDLSGNEGADISSLVVRREVRFSITTVCSRYTYDQIYGANKQTFTDDVNDFLRASLAKTYILLDNFLTGEIHLLPEQQTAINQKLIAAQNAAVAEILITQRRNEALARVEEAKGEAEYIRIINDQLGNSPFYIQLLYAQTWNGQLPLVLFTGGGADNLPIIALPEGLLTLPEVQPSTLGAGH